MTSKIQPGWVPNYLQDYTYLLFPTVQCTYYSFNISDTVLYQDLYLFIKGSALPFSWNVFFQTLSWPTP